MKGGYRCGLEATAHLPNQDILGYLEGCQEAFDLGLGGIDWETVSEDGKDEGVEDFAPVGIIKATDRIAKDL